MKRRCNEHIHSGSSDDGGERADREGRDKAQKLDANRFKMEGTVLNADGDGKLKAVEIDNEEHVKNGNVEEIKRAIYRPDVNGKMVAPTAELASITFLSKRGKQVERQFTDLM